MEMSLREAAKILGNSFGRRRRRGIDDERLLEILRTGALKAEFRVPELATIEIPLKYWKELSLSDFRRGVRKRGSHDGLYNVRIGPFTDTFIASLPKTNDASKVQSLTSALKRSDRACEVVLRRDDFNQYIATLRDNEDKRAKGGRSKSPDWKATATALAGMVLQARNITQNALLIELSDLDIEQPSDASLRDMIAVAAKANKQQPKEK